tara:strand:- start:427 stop:684 length:258 start_codon:yes stop_codon:yes gene_type:complete
MNPELARANVLEAVLAERERQVELWGRQLTHPDYWWYIIASEEHGEVATAIYDKDGENLMQEIIQTCAVYFAWAEAILSRSDNGN